MKGHRPKTLGFLLVLLSGSSKTVSSTELQQYLPPTTSSRTSGQSRNRMSRNLSGSCSNTASSSSSAAAAIVSPRALHSSGGGGALASIFRLSQRERKPHGALQSQPQPQSGAGLFQRLRDLCGHGNSPAVAPTAMSTTTTTTATGAGAAVAGFLQQITRLFRSELAQCSAEAQGRGSKIVAIVLGVACLLSVAAANTVVASRSSGRMGWGRSGGSSSSSSSGRSNLLIASSSNNTAVLTDADGAYADEDEARRYSSSGPLVSLRRRMGKLGSSAEDDVAAGGRGRRRIPVLGRPPWRVNAALVKAPRFPLAYVSWWKALHDRRERLALNIAEGVAVESHEVTERAEGAQLFRAAQFWGRSATIYLSYKKMQAKCALELPRVADLEKREQQRKEWWNGIHELNSDRMLKLCLDLRGFYLKSGQFLGTRHDFMPKVYLKKLGKLHDDVPPMAASRVSKVLSRELDEPVEELFSSFNLTHPVGSASISQVHRGVLRETGEKVAVKVQYPGAERVMMSDLRNLKVLAWFLQKFELDFDILSSLRELSKQIKGEFDFRSEARTMDRMHESLGHHSERLNLPSSRFSTKRLLIMSYVEGESLAQLKRGGKERFVATRKRIGKSLLHELADAWGYMIFQEGLFNADPHPGNILIVPEERVGPVRRCFSLLGLRTPKLRIGLLDWGQTKELSRQDREKVANVILAVSSQLSPDIVQSFKRLGVKLSNPDDADSIEKLALVMFDTRTIKGLDFNPFSSNNVLKLNAVKEYPQDLYFILRTVLMFRGMAQSLGVEFSLADCWAPHASRLLASPPHPA